MPRKKVDLPPREDFTVIAARAQAANLDPSYTDLEVGWDAWVQLVNTDIPNLANALTNAINAMRGL